MGDETKKAMRLQHAKSMKDDEVAGRIATTLGKPAK